MGRETNDSGGDGGEEEEEWPPRCAGGGRDRQQQRPFLDRSKVRILLCDNDTASSDDILTLLSNCSYQVACVRSARQVVDTLNAQGADIDIILAEVDLPAHKGFKMLKYIARNPDFRRIPIIMMSSKDEVSVVVKCLRLGAADYLVKPLRTNELLNLWTHMWRRRRSLGLSDKDIFCHDIDLVLSDPSDVNTNSTTLFSDDTDERMKGKVIQENLMPNRHEFESNQPLKEHQFNVGYEDLQDASEESDPASSYPFYPKKTDLKVAQSSAFCAYVKKSTLSLNLPRPSEGQEESMQAIHREELILSGQSFADVGTVEAAADRNDAVAEVRFHAMEAIQTRDFPSSSVQMNPASEGQATSLGAPNTYSLPIYYPRMIEQTGMTGVLPPSQGFPGSLNGIQTHDMSTFLSQYNVGNHVPHMPVMQSFPYSSFGISMQPSQVPAVGAWALPSANASMPAAKQDTSERRAAALMKFKQKRKERCFDKKIRYINRKKLAETRPRVRGQFVSQPSNVDALLNSSAAGDDDSEEDEDD